LSIRLATSHCKKRLVENPLKENPGRGQSSFWGCGATDEDDGGGGGGGGDDDDDWALIAVALNLEFLA
jgi:hypothetical protein